MVDRFSKITILTVLWMFVSFWSFNHIDAWVGIGIFVLGLYISAKLIFKNKK